MSSMLVRSHVRMVLPMLVAGLVGFISWPSLDALAAPSLSAVDVNVKNTPANPVPVTVTDQPTALSPFNACVPATTSNPTSTSSNLLTVPAGKLAVIEYVSGSFQVPNTFPDRFPVVRLGLAHSGGVNPDFYFSSVAQGSDGISYLTYTTSHMTRIYAPAGALVSAEARNGSLSIAGGTICISGHYETAP